MGGFGSSSKWRLAKVFFHNFWGNQTCVPDGLSGCHGISAATHADVFFMEIFEYQSTKYLRARGHDPHKRRPTRETVPSWLILPTKKHCVDDDGDGVESCIAVPARAETYLRRVYGNGWRWPARFKVCMQSTCLVLDLIRSLSVVVLCRKRVVVLAVLAKLHAPIESALSIGRTLRALVTIRDQDAGGAHV